MKFIFGFIILNKLERKLWNYIKVKAKNSENEWYHLKNSTQNILNTELCPPPLKIEKEEEQLIENIYKKYKEKFFIIISISHKQVLYLIYEEFKNKVI